MVFNVRNYYKVVQRLPRERIWVDRKEAIACLAVEAISHGVMLPELLPALFLPRVEDICVQQFHELFDEFE